MSDRRPTKGRGRLLRHLLLITVLGAALLSFGAVSGLAADTSVETAGALGSYHWQPNAGEITPGGSVEFKNSQANPHGVVFEAPPSAPNCTGVPSVGTTNWSGSCTFAQAGTYKFYCPVHPTEMKGTITVNGPAAPVATTEPATAVKQTEATLNGKVNPSGQATTYFFKYGTSAAYGSETTHETAGSGTTAIAKFATVSGLTAATTYHFQIVAENGSGTVTGVDRTFTTAGPPTATTEPASGIGSIQATLKGTVNPKGLDTEYFFKYGTSTAYGQLTTAKDAGSGTANTIASQLVAGLTPKTTYHFVLVAKSAAGEVIGSDRTFATTGGPLATTGEAGGVSETGATLAGVVNPQGQTTSYSFNYGTSTAYGLKTTEQTAGAGSADVPVSEPISGLAPGTTYHFQLVAHSGADTSTGEDATFITAAAPPPPPPVIDTPIPPVIDIPPPLSPPETKITLKPPAKTHASKVKIKFSAGGGAASYLCSVDSKAFKACKSPFTTPKLKPGNHKIRVKAVVDGLADPSPASCSFKVLAAK
jgi:plastocyanin